MAQNKIVIRGPVVDEWTKAFQDIAKSVTSLKGTLDQVQKQTASFDSIFSNTKNFKAFINLLKEVDDDSSKSFRRLGLGFANFAAGLKELQTVQFSQLEELPKLLSSLVKSVATFKVPDLDSGLSNLRDLFAAIAGLSKTVDSNKLSGLKDISSIGTSLFRTLNSLSNLTAKIDKLDFSTKGFAGITSKFGALKPVFALIREVVNNVTATTAGLNFKPESISALVDLLKFFSTDIKGGLPVAPLLGFVDSLEQLSKDFPSFRGEGLLSKFQEFAKLDPLFKLIEVIVKRLSTISIRADQSVGLDRITQLISIFPKITKIMPKLLESIERIPEFRGQVLLNRLRPFARLDPLFALIKRVVTQLSKIAGGVQGEGSGVKNLAKLIKTLDNLSVAVPRILTFASKLKVGVLPNLKDLANSIKVSRQIGGFLGVIGQIFRPLDILAGDLKNVDKLTAIVKALKTITEIAEKLGTVEFIVPSGFAGFIKSIVSALNPLQGINVNPGQVREFSESLTDLGDSGQSIGKVKAIGSIFGSIGDQIKRSIVDNVVRRVVDSAINALVKLKDGVLNFQKSVGTAFKNLANVLESGSRQLIDTGQRLFNDFGVKALQESAGFQLAEGFDDLSKQIQVFAQNIPIKEAQEFANLIGIQYPLSANEALSAVLDLAKAGQQFGDIKNILPSAADLASLSESGDLDKATKFLIAARSGFNEFAKGIEGTFANTEVAANAVFRAANVSTASVDGLIEGLNVAAPTANRFNVSLQDTAAYLTLFEDAGIRGSQAGNLFSTVLGEISKPKARDELNRLGVAWQNTDGTLRDVSLILGDVQKRYQELNLTQVETSNSLRELGGDKFGQQGLSIIFGRGGINDVVESMGDLRDETNSARNAAQKLLESLKGQLEQLSGSFDTLLTKIFLPILDRFFLPLVKIARIAVDSLLALPDPITETISSAIALLSLFATIGGTILVVVGVVGQLSASFLAFVGTVISLTALIPQLVFGFSALVGSLAIALPLILLIGAAFVSLSSIVTNVFRAIEDETTPLSKTFENLKKEFQLTFDVLKRLAEDALTVIKLVFGDVFNESSADRLSAVSHAFETIAKAVQNLRKQLEQIDTEALAVFFIRIREAIFPLVRAVDQIGGGIFQLIFGDLQGLDRIQRGLSSILYVATNFIGQLTGIDFEKALARFDAGHIRKGLVALFDILRTEFKNFVAKNSGVLTDIFGQIFQFINPFSKIGNVLEFIGLEDLANQFKSIGNVVTDAFKGIFDIVLSILSGGDIAKAFERNFGTIGLAFFGVADQIGKAITLIVQIVEAFFDLFESTDRQQVITDYTGAITGGFNVISSAIGSFNTNVLTPLRDNLPFILNQLSILANQIIQDFGPMGQWVKFVAEQFSLLFDTFQEVLSGDLDIGSFFIDLAGRLIAVFATLPQAIGKTLSNIGETIGSEFLISLGDAFRTGNLLQFVGNVLRGVLSIFVKMLKSLPQHLLGIAEETGNIWLYQLARALKEGDFSTVARQIGSAVVSLIKQALDFAFNALVDLFDTWLDLFDNRIVGGFTLLLVSGLVTAAGVLALQLPSILGGLLPAVGGIGVSLANALGLSFVTTLASGVWFIGAIAVITAILGTLIYTIFNDPDILLTAEEAGRLYSKRLTYGLRDSIVNSSIGDSIIEGLSEIFKFTALIDTISESVLEVADSVEDTISNALVGVLGSQFEPVARRLASLVALPIETLGNLIGVVSSIIQGTIQNIIQFSNFLAYTAELLVNAFRGPINFFIIAKNFIGDTINFITANIGNIGKTIALIGAGVAAAVLVFRNWDSIVSILRSSLGSLSSAIAGVGSSAQSASTGINQMTGSLTQADQAAQVASNNAVKAGFSLRNAFAGIQNIASSAFSAIKAVGGAAAVLAVVNSGAKAINTTFQNQENIVSGLIRFITDLGLEALKFFGFGGEIETQVRTTVDQLIKLSEAFGKQINKFLSGLFDKLLVTIADIRSQIEIAAEAITGETATAARNFQLAQETIAGNVAGGFSFWNTLLQTSDFDSVKALLRSNSEELLQEIDNTLARGSDIEIGTAAGVLADAGLLDEAIQQTENSFKQLAFIYSSASLDDRFDVEPNPEAAQAFVDKLLQLPPEEIAAVSATNSQLIKDAVTTLVRDFEAGFIDQEQRDISLEKLGFRFVDDVGVVAIEDAARLRNEVFDATSEVAERAASAIDEFNQKLADGSATAEDYKNAVASLAEELNALLQQTATERLAELNSQFEAGEITSREYRVEVNELFDELETSAVDQTSDALELLDRALAQGKITSADYAEEVSELDSVLQNIRDQREVETQIADLRIAYNSGELTAEEFRQEVQQVIKDANAIKSAIGEEPLILDVEFEEPTLPQFQDIEADPLVVEQSAEEVEKEKEKVDKLNKSFADKEKKALDDISKTREDYIRDLKKVEDDAFIKRERDAQDHQKRLTEIAKSGAQGVVDAVAARDSAAAQSAINRAVQEKNSEDEKFKLDQKRAAEDLDRRKQELAEQAQLRIIEQQERLQEIRIEHQQELAELQAKHQQVLATEKAHTQEVVAEGENKKQTLGQQIRTFWENLSSTINDSLSKLANSSNSFLSNIGKAGQSLISSGSNIFSSIGSVIKGKIEELSNGSSIFSKFGKVASGIINVGTKITGALFGGGGGATSPTTTSGSKFGYKNFGSASQPSANTEQLATTVQDNLKKVVSIFGGFGFGGTKHKGGPTRAGEFYHVGGPRPELYQERGNTYLIPSGAGRVTPPSASPFARMPSGQDSLELNFNAGGMNFSGTNFNAEEVLREMENVIIPKLSDVIRKVRNQRKNSI